MSRFTDLLFRKVPGPSPWYLTDDLVPLDGFSWQHAERDDRAAAGKVFLRGASGIVGVFDFYNYVNVLDSSTLLVWNQRRGVRFPYVSPVELFIIELRKLACLSEPMDAIYQRLNAKKDFFVIGGTASATLSLSTTNVNDVVQAEFPDSMRLTDELLILCHSREARTSAKSADLALLVAEPRASIYRLYPQDWFNNADMDFGYQWVTRVVRNPNTGHVEGEGFRIPRFVLGDSLREIRELIDTED